MRRLKLVGDKKRQFTVWPLLNIQILIMTEEEQLLDMCHGDVYLEAMK